jgi:hypothetical protein
MRRALLLLVLTGCAKSQILDFTMSSAPHVARVDRRIGPYQLLAGDMHCHVLPPDAPYHVSRTLPETQALAEREGLDFVVLTPHVPARFFTSIDYRDWVRRSQAELRERIAALPASNVLLVPGMEYTDPFYGHIGLSFADPNPILDAISINDLLAHPDRFFEAWHSAGGLATINHPFLSPIPKSPLIELRSDLSWRGDNPDAGPELDWLAHHADAVETWNLSVGHTRDRWFFGDPDWELRQAAHFADDRARSQNRTVAHVGGSDSHGGWLRPTTFVLAQERTLPSIRAAIVAGRTCVRAPDACTLQVNGAYIGDSIASGPSHIVHARVEGPSATYFVNGTATTDGEIRVTGECTLIRAAVGDSVSSPIYVDCPMKSGPPFSSAR